MWRILTCTCMYFDLIGDQPGSQSQKLHNPRMCNIEHKHLNVSMKEYFTMVQWLDLSLHLWIFPGLSLNSGNLVQRIDGL